MKDTFLIFVFLLQEQFVYLQSEVEVEKGKLKFSSFYKKTASICVTNLYRYQYTIIYNYDEFTGILPYISAQSIYIENRCSNNRQQTGFGITRKKYSMAVSSCLPIHVRSVCHDLKKFPDYIPRNCSFTCNFNCDKLETKSIMCGKNNVRVYIQRNIVNILHIDLFRYNISEYPNTSLWNRNLSLHQNYLFDSPGFKYDNTINFILLDALIIFVIPVAVIVLVLIKKRTHKIPYRTLTRRREFDAYMCYKVDSDGEYAEDIILPELQENYDPPFSICIHRDHFQPGRTIKRNVIGAIQKSNSAIIIISQDFVNSVWCREEFADCYVENMNDPAFKLCVIMLQPVEELENLSEYMTSYFSRYTYLEKNDPHLFTKIAEHLIRVKAPVDGDDKYKVIYNREDN